MMHALVLAWGLTLGYPYTPPRDLWLNSGGIPRYGVAVVTRYRPVVWVRIDW